MKSPSRPANQIVLSNHQGLGRIRVDMEAFFELSFWMAEELLDLTGRWADKAAPKDRQLNSSLSEIDRSR